MADRIDTSPVYARAARQSQRRSDQREVVVMDSADFVGVSQMRQQFLARVADRKPTLMLLERGELQRLQPLLEFNSSLDFVIKPVDYETLQARIDKLTATMSEFVERQSQLERVQAQVDRLTYYDRVTHLPNNEFFRRHLELQIHHARRHQHQLAVLALELQSFERTKRLAGQAGIEKLLAESGERIMNATRDYDVVGQGPDVLPFTNERLVTRFDGDQFLLMMPQVRQIKDITGIVERLLSVLESPIAAEGQEIVPRPIVGISIYPSDGDSEGVLISNARSALKVSNHQGPRRHSFFTQSLN